MFSFRQINYIGHTLELGKMKNEMSKDKRKGRLSHGAFKR